MSLDVVQRLLRTKVAFSHEEGVELYEPWKNRNQPHPLNNMGALFHMIKSSLGVGVLAMPVAFKNGGLWVGLGCTFLVAVIYTHCVHILISSSRRLCTRLKQPKLGFTEIAEAAFRTGPTSCRRYTATAKNIVDLGLVCGYLGCCIVYVVFSASGLKQVIEYDFEVSMDVRWYILAVTMFVLPIGIIRNLKYLVPFSFIANAALTIGCCFVLYEIFQDLPPLSSRPAFRSWDRLPFLICTVICAVDGIGQVIPIESAMNNAEHFLGCTGILNASMLWTMVLCGTMGFFGYLRYGEETAGSITLNISESKMGQTVKLMVVMNVICSYGLVMYNPREVSWRKIEGYIGKSRKTLKYYSMRVIIILFTVFVALIVPDVEPILGLLGAVSISTLVLFFPPVIELVTFWEDDEYMGPYRWKAYKNYMIIILWIITLVAGTHISIEKIVKLYQ